MDMASTQSPTLCNVPEHTSSYNVTIGRDNIRVVSVFSGTKTASELIHEAAVKKILYDQTED